MEFICANNIKNTFIVRVIAILPFNYAHVLLGYLIPNFKLAMNLQIP